MTTLTIEKVIPAFVAWTNTDCTEGRGWQIPLAVCEKKATAIRLGRKGSVQGTDCAIGQLDIYKINGLWYGPIWLKGSTREDDREQESIDAREAVIGKARKAGLTDEEIQTLSKS